MKKEEYNKFIINEYKGPDFQNKSQTKERIQIIKTKSLFLYEL